MLLGEIVMNIFVRVFESEIPVIDDIVEQMFLSKI